MLSLLPLKTLAIEHFLPEDESISDVALFPILLTLAKNLAAMLLPVLDRFASVFSVVRQSHSSIH